MSERSTPYIKILRNCVFIVPCVLVFQNCGPGFSPLGSDHLLSVSGSSGLVERMTCVEANRGTADSASRKLTRSEIQRSLAVVFGSKVVENSKVVAALENLTTETSKTFGRNFSLNLTTSHLDGIVAIAESVSSVVVNDRAILSFVLNGCDPDTNLQACSDTLLSNFATKILRRPIAAETKAEISSLMAQYSGAERLQIGIARLMLSPYFYQHIEIGEQANGKRVKLTSYEVASRLSYRLLGSGPDDELLSAAATNALSSKQQLNAQASRLIISPQARSHFREFTSLWLGLEKTPDPDPGISKVRGIASVGLGAEAREEMLRYVDYMVFEKKAGFEELFSSPIVFPYTDRLANLYGVPKSNAPVSVSDGRGGMILRIANLINNSMNSNPIVRGGHIRTHLLCQEIPPPDPALVATRLSETEILSPLNLSNRAIVHQTTAVPQCASCHSMINPLGFSLEGYDGFGLPRAKEEVYDADKNVVAEHNVDSYVTDLNIASVPRPVNGGSDLTRELANSDRAKLCLAKKIIEFTRERAATHADACSVNEGVEVMEAKGSVFEFLIASAITEDIFWKAALQ